MLATLCAAALVCASSFAIGQAILKVSGLRPSAGWAGSVGFAAAMALTSACVRLPGEGAAGAVGLVLATAGAVVYVRSDWRRPPRELLWALLAVVVLVLLPYAANARFGVLGVGFNNDTALHLVWTEWLASGGERGLEPSAGYPTGPHAITAAAGALLGVASDRALMGMVMAVPLLTLFTFSSLMRDLPGGRRAVGGVLVTLCYLSAAYYAQAAFKETVQVLLFAGSIAFVAHAGALRARALLVPGVLMAGFFYNYSYTGIAWPVLTLLVWGAAVLVQRRGASVAEVRAALPRGPELRRAGLGALLVAGAAAVLLAPELSRIPDFIRQLGSSPSATGAIGAENVGNLRGPVSSFEAFGLWPSSDFRFTPKPDFWKYVLGGIGLAATLIGSAWCVRRRQLLVPAAGVASAAIYLVLEARESVYIAAKGLAILAPFAILPAALWLLTPDRRWKTVAAAAFTGVALYSSFLALTGASVGPREPGDDLAKLRPVVAGSSVLALVNDDYLRWDLRGTRKLTTLYFFGPRPQKRFTDGTAADIDSAPAEVINAHRYVLTTNTPYASTPPAALSMVRRTRLFTLWRREGRVSERRTLIEGGAPGGPLDCSTPQGRAIAAKRGWAVVVPRPAELVLEGSRRFVGDDGRRVSIGLPRGRWDVSLQYTSSHPVEVRGGGLSGELPAVLDRSGSFRVAGRVNHPSAGPLDLTLRVEDPSPLPTVSRGAIVDRVAATRAGARPRAVPLRRACGLYVDWYTLGPGRPAGF